MGPRKHKVELFKFWIINWNNCEYIFFFAFWFSFFANKKTFKKTKIYSSFASSTGTIVSLKSMKIFDKLIGARGASCVDEILHAGRALLVCHSTALKIAKIMHLIISKKNSSKGYNYLLFDRFSLLCSQIHGHSVQNISL